MSARLEYAARQRIGAVLRHVGTAPVGDALLVLAVVFVAAERIWARAGTPATASALGSSFAYRALAAALVADGLVAILRAVPLAGGAGGARVPRLPTLGEWSALAARAARALVGLALLASVLSRDVFTLHVAEGEEPAADPGQIVDRDPVRPLSPGLFPAPVTVRRVEGRISARGDVTDLAVDVDRGRETIRATGWRPLWFGFGRFGLPVRAGFAPRYAIETAGGALVESAFARLELFPEGRLASIRAGAVPYRVFVALASDQSAGTGVAPVVDVAVYRGKLLVARGALAPGTSLEFEGLRVRFPEWRRWVELRMIRDPGIALAGLAALVAGTGWLLGLASRRIATSRERSA